MPSFRDPVIERCPVCRSGPMLNERVRTPDPQRRTIAVHACERCGDWWFTCDGVRIGPDALSSLGLLR